MTKTTLYLLIMIVLFPLFSGSVLMAGYLDNWTVRSPLPTTSYLQDVVYGNAGFMAVGGVEGAIVVSADGVEWEKRNSPTAHYLYGITYGNSTYVVVGDYGTIVTSGDGVKWRTRNSGTIQNLYEITYANSMFVVVGRNGIILTSPDGVHWTTRDSGTTRGIWSVTYGSGIFVAVGGRNTILTSPDGVNWTGRDPGVSNAFSSVTYGNSLFVASGGTGLIITSPDGINWTERRGSTPHHRIYALTYSNSLFVAVGTFDSDKILTSVDGINWRGRGSGIANSLFGVTYGDSIFVAVGSYGTIVTSPDGVHWTRRTKGPGHNLYGIDYGNSTFVAVGDSGTVLSSPHGVNWTSHNSGTTEDINDVSHDNHLFVAVGNHGTILTSPDGARWTIRDSGITGNLGGVTYGNSKFVAVGENHILTSPDGVNWTPSPINSHIGSLNSVAYGGSRFVAVGWSDSAAVSEDGINWTLSNRYGYSDYSLRAVTYTGSLFVAAGNLGYVFTSPDGMTWTDVHFDLMCSFHGLVYANSTLLVVGLLTMGSNIYTSTDYVEWTPRGAFKRFALRDVTYGRSTFVAVGRGGGIVQSGPPHIRIDGTITSGNSELPGVVLNGLPGDPVTDAYGNYRAYVGNGWSGTATPTLAGYTFSPASTTYSDVTSRRTTDYTAALLNTYTISGTVTDGQNPVTGVTVTFSQNGHTETVNGAGYYSYTVGHGTTTTVTPSKDGCMFTPSEYSYTGITEDKTGGDFTVSEIQVSVSITAPLDGDTVSGSVTVTADPRLNPVLTSDGTGETFKGVDIYIDDVPAASDPDSPYQFQWDTPRESNGEHRVKAVVTHTGGKTAEDEITVIVNNFTEPPHLEFNRGRLNYGAIIGGAHTGAQVFKARNTGGGLLDWAASISDTWMEVSPLSGTSGTVVTVSVDPTGLTAGSYTGSISFSDVYADNAPASVAIHLEVKDIAAESPLTGILDTPSDGTTAAGSISITGWALDDTEVTRVAVYGTAAGGQTADRFHIGDAVFVEDARPDVEETYPEYPKNYRAGWGLMALTNSFPNNGNGTFIITAVGGDGSGNEVLLGSRTLICDNEHSVKPFGVLDTPVRGSVVSGTDFVNYGWALTPLPNTIPNDGSTITVLIDGVPQPGQPVYNGYRVDIAERFPGYKNSSGAVGYYFLDTTFFADGLHTISWDVRDDAGNEGGSGSYYFRISNEGNGNRTSGTASRFINETVPKYPGPSFLPVYLERGNALLYPDNEGVIPISVKEGERMVIRFKNRTVVAGGYLVFGKEKRDLPVGSFLDKEEGIFYWQLGPGFTGLYRLEFIEKGTHGEWAKKIIKVVIEPGNTPHLKSQSAGE